MLRYLWDPANAVTGGGLIFSGLSLYLALAGDLNLAVAVALWAVLADHLDGVVAGKIKNRHPDLSRMGKSLDGFADMIYGAVVPAVIIMQASEASVLALVTGVALLCCGALRLSYFANFGLSGDRCFLGVPLSYDVPLLAALFLAEPVLAPYGFATLISIAFLVLSALHVAPIRIPSPDRQTYVAITVFAVLASLGLIHRSFS